MLSKADDYPVHQTAEPIAYAGTDRNFYDRYFFNGYSKSGEHFFAAAMGIYPHLNVIGQFVETPLPGHAPAKLPKLPVRSTAFEMGLRRPAPTLGEHTREVLEEIGLTGEEIDALASRRIIG